MNSELPRGSKPRVAYLTTEYPNVSHTFIRREIIGLEARGYSIHRISIRVGKSIVEPIDFDEAKATFHILQGGVLERARYAMRGLTHARHRLLNAISEVWTLSKRSDRGLIRHMAYLLEALILLGFVRSQRIEHVHVHFGTNAAAIALLCRLLGGPGYSIAVHGPDEFDAPIGLSLDRKLESAEFVAAISSYCSAQLMRWSSSHNWHKISVVRCTVDDMWFKNSIEVDPNSHTFVSVGRLSEQKGQALLIESFARALGSVPDAKLLIIGDGPLRGELERRIEHLGLTGSISLLGWQSADQIRSALLKSRALVLPSFAEGLPVVIMEAMALGRPVITTYVAGIPELVLHEENGWLCYAGDSPSLVEAMRAALVTPGDRMLSMGRAARERVREMHSVEQQCERLDQLICAVQNDH